MRDSLCSYYTDSEDITNYMASMLEVNDGDVILEPSAGSGLFIDELLKQNKNIHIDGLDIDKEAIAVLKEKYKDNDSVRIRETDTLFDNELDSFQQTDLWLKNTDTLLDEELDFFEAVGGHYTKVIGNPPYGAWQDYEKRDLLKKKYVGQYVKETYSLFLLRCISVLKMHGKLSFIIPDTFLFLNLHQKLRAFLLTKTKISEILIFPSKFFPGVSFGYSNLSIITVERSDRNSALENEIKIFKGFKNSSEFSLLHDSDKKLPDYIKTFALKQKDVFETPQHRFILAENSENTILVNSKTTLGDVADIVTGFYSGDNVRFIRAKDKSVKGAKNYELVDESKISDKTELCGISGTDEIYIPYVKSSSKTKYFKADDEWFVRWDKKTVDYYNSNKKSRFQNSAFYFKKGICIPMVKSSSINAFLMENRVFDQSIVGIFPKDEKKLLYILALMNSDVVNRMIHIINPTANNSSNYIKQIPYKEPKEEEQNKISRLVAEAIDSTQKQDFEKLSAVHKKINAEFEKIYAT
mgnify:CR=1 FL=1